MSLMIRMPKHMSMLTRRTWTFMGVTFVSSLSLTAVLTWSHWGISEPALAVIIFVAVCTIIAWMGLVASLTVDCVNRATGMWGKRIIATVREAHAEDETNVKYLHNYMRR